MTDGIEDPRCCGTGVCIVDPSGRCWCGQRWDGTKMCHPGVEPTASDSTEQSSTEQTRTSE